MLTRILDGLPQAEIEALVHASSHCDACAQDVFLYETLTVRTLDVEDAPRVPAIDLLDVETTGTQDAAGRA